MNFEFGQKINPSLEKLDFSQALDIAQTALNKIPTTEFHSALGKSFIIQADSLAIWIENFYQTILKNMDVKALYFEMNEFDINTGTWYIHGFSYEKDGGLNIENMEWLCDFTRDKMTTEEFVLTGFEELQTAFENIELDNDNLQASRDWCEQIIIARFMELMRTAHLKAKEMNFGWATIPIYFTEHSYDFILKSEPTKFLPI
jgi:hypothetical protein